MWREGRNVGVGSSSKSFSFKFNNYFKVNLRFNVEFMAISLIYIILDMTLDEYRVNMK